MRLKNTRTLLKLLGVSAAILSIDRALVGLGSYIVNARATRSHRAAQATAASSASSTNYAN